MKPQPGELRRPALEQVRRVQEALSALQVDFSQAHTAIRTTGQRLIGESWNQALFVVDRPPLEITCLSPHRHQLEDLQELLQDNAPQLWAPDLATIEPEAFQLFHLLATNPPSPNRKRAYPQSQYLNRAEVS